MPSYTTFCIELSASTGRYFTTFGRRKHHVHSFSRLPGQRCSLQLRGAKFPDLGLEIAKTYASLQQSMGYLLSCRPLGCQIHHTKLAPSRTSSQQSWNYLPLSGSGLQVGVPSSQAPPFRILVQAAMVIFGSFRLKWHQSSRSRPEDDLHIDLWFTSSAPDHRVARCIVLLVSAGDRSRCTSGSLTLAPSCQV